MKYMGSKARIAKHILPIILKDRKEGQWYVEPFVGGANMIDKVDGNRIGADSNKNLIDAIKVIRDNPAAIPRDCMELPESEYNKLRIKDDDDLTPVESLLLFACAFASRFKGGYAKNNRGDDYVKQAYNSANRQHEKLKGVDLLCCSVFDLKIPNNSIVYCDPPYENTATYKGAEGFNHELFWQWCRDKCKEGHRLFISEYNAPDDFICVWRQELKQSLGSNKKAIEKLFVHKSQA